MLRIGSIPNHILTVAFYSFLVQSAFMLFDLDIYFATYEGFKLSSEQLLDHIKEYNLHENFKVLVFSTVRVDDFGKFFLLHR